MMMSKAKANQLAIPRINGVKRLKLPTASQIGRVMVCLASWLLTRFESAANALMLAGTEAHAELFQAIEHGKEASFDTTGIFAWLAADGGSKPEGELALAYDSQTDTARVLGKNIDRAYEKHGADQSREFCMALDAISVRVGSSEGLARTGRVLDLKTGRSDGDVWQLKLNALAAARAFDLDSVRACFWYSATGQIQEWEWGAMDLAGFAQELEDVRRNLVAAYGHTPAPPAVTGEHCGWCRAFANCHAQVGLARSLVAESTAEGVSVEPAAFAALTPAEAGVAWDRLVSAEALLKHIRAGLEGYAQQQPLQLADGRVVRPIEARRESINGKIAYEVLAAKASEVGAAFTLGEVWEACPPSCSKDSLKRVLGKDGAAQALELIGEAGGIEVKTYQQVKAVKP